VEVYVGIVYIGSCDLAGHWTAVVRRLGVGRSELGLRSRCFGAGM